MLIVLYPIWAAVSGLIGALFLLAFVANDGAARLVILQKFLRNKINRGSK